MNADKLYQIILSPVISEKATTVGEKHKQIVFRVVKQANKHEIKHAIEKLFNVKVEEVRTTHVKPKAKRHGKHQGFRQGWKKAYISLLEGHDINFANMAAE